ncbi:CDP-diacylglycerol--glycerol-3-phosphate 3-phosphatidyltransferase [Chlamydia abortus]|jgi:CDP-diacylglycerol-glycerol-3-phosphate|nr:CDP-alcohol phosphatidyltransferase family protein [Chlamydia psittaci 02DC14]SFW06812.1 CDP-diacylglycerol--glycerol-3-phosphate 3-phosphatidyltransferase [Chlamydia abortus]SGA32765.1 CDP-diacylglycerol--glycerol-3-phosphate 3-phosphatidyltransferase [Chlamydia abortus]SGA33316.1 CDP-diacylglycerol--glycerol-3-phosphate 3-phosphatidyltransferase [Chlamydia abortus]SHE15339.1 CDP-diacylglycerol--glycerol-3-phosphate 3-phosphatidyltransferase [Chlamydia abortus]
MITDFIDGHYARKHKTVSVFGKIFDPIADKVATTLMFLFLAIMEFTYLPLIILFIMRDILVDGSRMYASKKNIKIAANV